MAFRNQSIFSITIVKLKDRKKKVLEFLFVENPGCSFIDNIQNPNCKRVFIMFKVFEMSFIFQLKEGTGNMVSLQIIEKKGIYKSKLFPEVFAFNFIVVEIKEIIRIFYRFVGKITILNIFFKQIPQNCFIVVRF